MSTKYQEEPSDPTPIQRGQTVEMPRLCLDRFVTASGALLRKRSLLARREDKYVLPLEQLAAFLSAMPSAYHLVDSGEGRGVPYQTLYFDSQDLALFRRGESCPAKRQKIRLRRYPTRQLSYLEIKSKDVRGLSSKKRLLREMCSKRLSAEDWAFVSENVPNIGLDLAPQVHVGYRRLTFLALGVQERMTVDIDLHYRQVDREDWLQGAAVIEVKRPPEHRPSFAAQWLRSRGIPLSDFSKFRTGLWLRGHTVVPPSMDLRLWSLALVRPSDADE